MDDDDDDTVASSSTSATHCSLEGLLSDNGHGK